MKQPTASRTTFETSRNTSSSWIAATIAGATVCGMREIDMHQPSARPILAQTGSDPQNALSDASGAGNPYAFEASRGFTVAHGHGYLPVHRHRGEHSPLGAGPGADAAGAGSP